MKKNLNLTILTIISILLLNLTKINLNFQIQKREITSTPIIPSLQEIITTININQIKINDQEHIIQGLQQAQNLNPATNIVREFLLEQNTNNNLEFENINLNSARVHLRNNQRLKTVTISKIINFTINFTTIQPILSDIITNNNLGEITNNSNYTILQTLLNTYPLITQLNLHLNVSNITLNTARISYNSNSNFSSSRNNYVDINFQTNHPIFNTMNLTTNLGELPNNLVPTIQTAFLNANSNNNLLLPENIITIWEITNNSATIYGRARIEALIYDEDENGRFQRPRTTEEEENNIETFYDILTNNIQVTFTLQNNNQNETQITRPNINSNDNNFLNYCANNINLNHQSIEKRNIENSNDKQNCNSINEILTKNLIKDNLKSNILNIKSVQKDNTYIVNNNKEIYDLNLNDWNLTKIQNAESNNLEKEIKLFYNQQKESVEIENNWWYKPWNYTIVHDFNLGKINPLDYQKIEFLGANKDFYSKISWGDTAYYGKKLNKYNCKNLKNYLAPCHVIKTLDGVDECNQLISFAIQSLNESYFLAHITGYQDYFLTWYKKDDNYHIQVIVEQEIRITNSAIGGSAWLNIGKGIRLYND